MARNGYSKLIEQIAATQNTMQETLAKQGALLAALNQKAGDTHDRLFGSGGAISSIIAKVKEIETANQKAVQELTEKHDKLDTKVTWYAGIATGAGAILAGAGKVIASKLGWHI
jgi:prefoldin subunit 5